MKKLVNDRFVRIVFLISGVYDILLGFCLLFLVDFFSSILYTTKPDPMIIPQVLGLFLFIIGYFLVYATNDLERLAFIGVGSCFVRLTYTFLILINMVTEKIKVIYLFLALTDSLTGSLILIALLLTEGISWKDMWLVEKY